MSTILESLRLYFQNNSREQIEKDWSELEKYDKMGLKVEEFMDHCKLFYEFKTKDSYWEYTCLSQIIKNPKFASDFFLTQFYKINKNKKMNKAAFTLEGYQFEKVNIDFSKKTSNDLDIGFEPSGRFISNDSCYELRFVFIAHNEAPENAFIKIECIALFKFEENIKFEEIPSYFYRNSIAILFPYIRAFISTVTLQANIPPIILPTMNLSSLENSLRESTEQI